MYNYSLTQWILFFFWYCFLGWIWECLFVSAQRAWKNKKWEFVNRGFLHGPIIPIYGFAAITDDDSGTGECNSDLCAGSTDGYYI